MFGFFRIAKAYRSSSESLHIKTQAIHVWSRYNSICLVLCQTQSVASPPSVCDRLSCYNRRRINTEEKAKDVAAVWGQNLFHSLPC